MLEPLPLKLLDGMVDKTNNSTGHKIQSGARTAGSGAVEKRHPRRLLVAAIGSRRIGVFVDEVDGVAEGHVPTPLPHAPVSVLGVVCVRGHMLTALDPLALLGEPHAGEDWSPAAVVILRGDEQLAIGVDRIESPIEISDTEVEPSDRTDMRVVYGIVRCGGEQVTVLNVRELFAAAIQGEERRRKRF